MRVRTLLLCALLLASAGCLTNPQVAAKQKTPAEPVYVAKFFDVEMLPATGQPRGPVGNVLHFDIPEQPHAGYGVVCTPRAPAKFWVTNRTTTGFDVATDGTNGNNFDCLVFL